MTNMIETMTLDDESLLKGKLPRVAEVLLKKMSGFSFLVK